MSSYSDTLEALSKAARQPAPKLSMDDPLAYQTAHDEYWEAQESLAESLDDHTEDFVRLLRAAERKVTNDPRRCAELAEALAAFEEE